MKDLILVLFSIIMAIFMFLNFKILNIIILLFFIVFIFYSVTKNTGLLFILLMLVFYIYLSFITYNDSFQGKKNFYVKFDGKTGTVLKIENKYTEKKILINNTNFSYGYYKILYEIKDMKEKNGFFLIKGRFISSQESKINVLRDFILAKLDKIFRDEYSLASFSKAAILGEKNSLDTDFNNMFKNTGLSHLLVISGLHIGLVTIVFLRLFEKLVISYRLKYILTWILLTAYCVIVGFSVSVLRTYITGSIMILAKLLFEEQDGKKSFFISMIITLIIIPYSLFDISFQLSYGAVASILFAFPIIEKIYLLLFKVNDKFLDYIIKMILLSLIIQIMTAPVFVYNFQTLPVTAFLSNIVGIPLGTLLIQSLFFLLLVNILGIEIFNSFFLLIIKMIFNSFETIVYFIDKVPLLQLNIDIKIHWIFIALYYGLIFIVLYFINKLPMKHNFKIIK